MILIRKEVPEEVGEVLARDTIVGDVDVHTNAISSSSMPKSTPEMSIYAQNHRVLASNIDRPYNLKSRPNKGRST